MLEQAVYALQQILTLAVDQGDLESEAFLYELVRNYQLLQNPLLIAVLLLYTLWNLRLRVALIILEGRNWK